MQMLAFWTVSHFANKSAGRWHIKKGQLRKLKSTPYAHWLLTIFKLTHKKRQVGKTLDLTSLLVCYMKHNYVIDGLKDNEEAENSKFSFQRATALSK
jgi:hypothetical protein